MHTRPKISWSDLAGAKVGVWGLGVEGRASLRKLRSMRLEPVLVDDRPPAPTTGGLPVIPTDGGGIEELERCDVVVKTPGITRYRPEADRLIDKGISVVGGLGLWMQEAARDRVICITGTKGKSTTTAILGHLLQQLGRRCMVGGNLGQPPYDPDVGVGYDLWVIETSSYQATDLASSPRIVAATSLHPDHLDWHGDADTYYRDKLSACSQPGAELTIANADSDLLRQRELLLGPYVRWVSSEDQMSTSWTAALGLIGAHNHRNARIAEACLHALGIPEAGDAVALREAAAGFPGLDSRLRFIGTVNGVDFVDDSLATNVLPTLSALAAFMGRRMALIVGGFDRGIDYGPLVDGLLQREAPTLALTIPDSGPRIHAAITARACPPWLEAETCSDLEGAVRIAFDWAQPDGVILLSPAAPSFGRFQNYHQRGVAFANAMLACEELSRSS